jgi:hypothetical protein
MGERRAASTSLTDDDEDTASAVHLPGAEPRRASSLLRRLPQEAGVVVARDASEVPARVGWPGMERADRLALRG